jgi:hypothetical protein
MQEFPRLREFEFRAYFHVHAEDLPAPLRRLKITHNRTDQCTCTLNAVQNLEHFGLDYDDSLPDEPREESDVPLSSLDRILPTKSSTTLRRLDLDLCHFSLQIDYSTLDIFRHLKELHIKFSTRSFFEYLSTSALRLESIRVHIATLDALNGLAPSIDSPSLGSLENFDVLIKIEGDDEDDDKIDAAWEPAVAAIARLPNLKTINFNAPLQADWSIHFEQCTRIQGLRWAYYDYNDEGPHVCPARPAFKLALKHIRPKPYIEIREHQWWLDE